MCWSKHRVVAFLLFWSLHSGVVDADLKAWAEAAARKDYAAAIRELRPVAEKGNARAQFELGIIYLYGEGVAASDKIAASWFRKAAEQGYILAKLSLGTMYVDGRGVPQDFTEGRLLLTAAAQAGNEFAALNLGKLYEKGKGVDQDFSEALRWYRVAADQNNPVGEHRVGNYYWIGQGVERNMLEARRWLQRSADQGDPSSQADLSLIYFRGDGVIPNNQHACFWSRLALKRLESDDYRQHAARVKSAACQALTAENLKVVDQQLDEWKPNCIWCVRQKREREERLLVGQEPSQ